MDSTSVLSDDDYDLISNPSQRSLESSLADLAERPAQIPELPPSEAARCKFETTRWSASDVQAYFRNTLDLGSSIKKDDLENKTVRVYVDGVFDAFNVG
jgi:choline-phosphate cytidylyltransferase